MASLVAENGLLQIQVGNTVEILYKDHVLFKELNAADQVPRLRRVRGQVDYQNEEYIRLIFESYRDADPSAPATSTGRVILRSTILKVRKYSS